MELILLLLLVVVFLGLPILSMRKQGKQINEIKSFQSQLEPGMIVQMTSGLHGRIDEVGPTTVSLELTPGVITTWDRSAVLKAVEPVEDSADFEEGEDHVGDSADAADNSENFAEGADSQVPDSPEGIEDFDSPRDGDDNSDRPRD
ncbi:MAG TPA: preprotein translocase subunit YajC [Candidatus Corynebacterium faecigallinarum]|uniref:Preprotein translocase subunit YajC n=1 Tax=Candidatus Corynebacterium faecigallinarum TaxID=2838528 RepID=A0A9D2QE50_9CORY|nr:preprotein translocase subunit YajC [Candidatus Corynebacterium faecigallinarum]